MVVTAIKTLFPRFFLFDVVKRLLLVTDVTICHFLSSVFLTLDASEVSKMLTSVTSGSLFCRRRLRTAIQKHMPDIKALAADENEPKSPACSGKKVTFQGQ